MKHLSEEETKEKIALYCDKLNGVLFDYNRKNDENATIIYMPENELKEYTELLEAWPVYHWGVPVKAWDGVTVIALGEGANE